MSHRAFTPAPTAAGVSRRQFVKASAATATLLAASPFAVAAYNGRPARIRVGAVGCGGRGTGAIVDILNASSETEIVALADVFRDRLDGCRE